MKIIEIVHSLQSGGAERFVVDLSNELAKNNDVTLLTLKNDKVNPKLRNFYREEITERVIYECLGLKDGLRPSMWWKIWKFIHTQRPDVVHFHGDTIAYWMLVPIIFSSRKIKFIQTLHSSVHWGKYDSGINKLTAITAGKYCKLRYAALSQTNYEEFKRVYPNLLSTCIVNGRAPMLPTNRYEIVKQEVASYKTTPATKIFLHVGRCNEVKNQLKLVRTFNRLVDCGHNAELLIIGDYFDEEELGKQIKSESCSHIHFLGTRKNIADYQLNADAFCLSSNSEGMPISLLEAVLSGTPAVSTPVCGAIDIIKDGYNGTLATDFTEESYYDALLRMFNNNSTYAKNIKLEKNNSYTIAQCAINYLDFFKKDC